MNQILQHRIFQHPLIQKLMPASRGRLMIWTAIILLSGVFAFVLDNRKPETTAAEIEPESPESAATFIPAGFVLVPIEVANYESLDSILGKFGVVDLYTSSIDPNQRPKKIAARIKILRAPLNPNHFAVLAAEEDSSKLVGFSGPLTVVVQNPNSPGTGFVKGLPTNDGQKSLKPSKRKISRVTVEVANVDPENENQ